MARIRSIKPDFWTSAQIIECSPNARLLFIGIWNFCDDAGRHSWSPRQLMAQVFPGDGLSIEDMERMLGELSSNDLIRRYTVGGKDYFYVTGWKHQKIDRPQKPVCPDPLVEHSSNSIDGGEGIGQEGKGRREDLAAQQEIAPREEEVSRETAEPDLSPIEQRLREIAPKVESRDISPILALIDAGYDLEKHIVPVVKERAGKARTIAAWQYFVPAIEQAHGRNGAIKPRSEEPTVPMTWLTDEHFRWPAMSARYEIERGRKPPKKAGLGGMGWNFPTEWLEALPATPIAATIEKAAGESLRGLGGASESRRPQPGAQ